MTMVCSRVDCAERATALLVYDPRSAAAWMRDRDPVGDRGQGISLCGPHADRATVPMGWTLTDERSPAFTVPPEVTAPSSGKHEADEAPADPVTDDDGIAPAALADDATDCDAPIDAADVLTLWSDHPADPYHARRGDGDPALPESPLLARAFRAAHRS